MKKVSFILVMAFLAVVGFTSRPQAVASPAPAATAVPIVKPDLSSMKFLAGTWTCHSQLRGNDRPDTSTTTVELSGQWLVSHDVAPPFDKYRTRAINTSTYVGFDNNARRWVTLGVDDLGGYSVSTSPGWNGNTLVWTDKLVQGDTVGVTTLTKMSDAQYSFVNVFKNSKGSSQTQKGNCKKS